MTTPSSYYPVSPSMYYAPPLSSAPMIQSNLVHSSPMPFNHMQTHQPQISPTLMYRPIASYATPLASRPLVSGSGNIASLAAAAAAVSHTSSHSPPNGRMSVYSVGDPVCLKNFSGHYCGIGEIIQVLSWDQYQVRAYHPDASTIDATFPIQLLDQNAAGCQFSDLMRLKMYINNLKAENEKKLAAQMELMQRSQQQQQHQHAVMATPYSPVSSAGNSPTAITTRALVAATKNNSNGNGSPSPVVLVPFQSTSGVQYYQPMKPPCRFVACNYCRSQKSACDEGHPCKRCKNHNIPCVRNTAKQTKASAAQASKAMSLPANVQQPIAAITVQ